MRWQGGRQSTNVIDARGGGGWMRPAGGIGCGGFLVVIVIALLTGADPSALLRLLGGTGTGAPAEAPAAPPGGAPQDQLGRFASVVLADTEDTWQAIFARSGSRYEAPQLVLFNGSVGSACGYASAAVGPFYCPADRRLYLDLTFFEEMARRLQAPGDFAQAYVIAHEVGHHVQNLTGLAGQVRDAQQRSRSKADANALSVRMELQADCLAGVWAYHAHRERSLLEPGDVEEGLQAAAAIGDDTLQRRGAGHVQPESWTHGSSEQRVTWLRRGMESGDPGRCSTL
ncbi:MAG TPA: neutral zinc metallopeptidase [Vicinamibacteria bacterium]|jgi:hypothetical protein